MIYFRINNKLLLLLLIGSLYMAINAKANTDSLHIYKAQFHENINKERYQEAFKSSIQLFENSWKHPDTMLIWANHSYNLALKLNNPEFEIRALRNVSSATFKIGKYEESIIPALKADSILQLYPSDNEKFEILYRLAEGYEYTAKSELGMQKYSECYAIAEKLEMRKKLVQLDWKLGNIYKYNKDYKKAIEYYQKAFKRIDKNNRIWYLSIAAGIYDLRINLPDIFTHDKMVEACDSVFHFYHIIKNDKTLERLESYYFSMYVECISTNYNPEKLDKITFPTLKQLQKNFTDRSQLNSFLYGYIDLALLNKDFNRAEEYINGLYQLILNEKDLGFELAALLKNKKLKIAQNNYKALIPIMERIHEIDLELQGEERMNSISNLEGVLEAQKKGLEIKLLNKDKEILAQQAQQRFLLLIGFAAMAMLGFGFLWNAKRKNKIIQLQNKQLKQINNTKDRLFAIIGHDLRKPALSFRGISKKVNYLIQKKDFKKLEKYSTEIEQNALALNKLTDNLLNWALLQRGVMPYHPKEVNVSNSTKDVSMVFNNNIGEKQLQIVNNIPDDIIVYADPNALYTILTNLVDNAIKYTPENGKITLSAFTENQQIKIRIADTGIGMTKDKLNDIFLLKKNKSEQGTAGEKGTGLGLHLVKELVDLNKGVINAASELGSGTSFDIVLPTMRS